MRKLDRRERVAVTVWLVLTLVVWNGIYDLLLTRGIKDYLLRNALHQAGRGPEVSMTALLDFTVWEAFWVSTLWASVILFAGLWTVRMFSSTRPATSDFDQRLTTSD
jgi:hypothetical protein